jgi:hypothetical protein
MAASNATKEAIWLQVLLKDLGFPQVSATTLHADNLGCIALSNGTVTHSSAKDITISFVNVLPTQKLTYSMFPRRKCLPTSLPNNCHVKHLRNTEVL